MIVKNNSVKWEQSIKDLINRGYSLELTVFEVLKAQFVVKEVDDNVDFDTTQIEELISEYKSINAISNQSNGFILFFKSY